jgi:DNA-binding MarR family transcriptional regulator
VLLTEKGKALDAELRSYICSLEEALMEGVSREEREVLQRALVKMLYNLEETERKRV